MEINVGTEAERRDSEKTSINKVAQSDPCMIEISFYEIKSFLIAETSAKVVLLVGTLLIGGVISAYLSNIIINPVITIVSIILLILGLSLDTYLIITKFKELGDKGAGKWR